VLHPTHPIFPTTAPLDCTTRTDWERATVMPRGSLSSSTVGDLEAEVLRLCAAGFSAIVVDLRALHYTEPAGGRLLRRLGELTDRHHVTLTLDEPAAATR
jgi:anti-anti-sigma regulatory factor